MAFPLIPPSFQWTDNNGDPMVGGSVEFLDPATDLQIDTYPTRDDADAQTSPNGNPVDLDNYGAAEIFCEDLVAYKVVLRDADGAILRTIDNVETPSGSTAAADIVLADSGGFYTAADVEAGFAELGSTAGAGIIGIADGGGNFAATDVEAALTEIIDDYAATTTGNGASKIGIEDAQLAFTATDVEAALLEAKGITLVKTSDTVRTSASLTLDGELTGWLVQNAARYKVEGLLIWDTATSFDLQFRLTMSPTPDEDVALYITGDALDPGITTAVDALNTAVTHTMGGTATNATRVVATFLTTGQTTLDLYWASPSSNSATLRAGSYLTVERIA